MPETELTSCHTTTNTERRMRKEVTALKAMCQGLQRVKGDVPGFQQKVTGVVKMEKAVEEMEKKWKEQPKILQI